MNTTILRRLACISVLIAALLPSDSVAQEKQRVVILTDISNEPDDQESLVRFLTNANEFDVEGLIATTSCWKKNDPDLAAIHRVISAYEKVVPNLRLHHSDAHRRCIATTNQLSSNCSFGSIAENSTAYAKQSER